MENGNSLMGRMFFLCGIVGLLGYGNLMGSIFMHHRVWIMKKGEDVQSLEGNYLISIEHKGGPPLF